MNMYREGNEVRHSKKSRESREKRLEKGQREIEGCWELSEGPVVISPVVISKVRLSYLSRLHP